MAELCDLSAVELRRLIGCKQASPVEVLESHLARIAEVNPVLNAIVATCTERARSEASSAEAAVMGGRPLGPLHGLPLGVKDVHETAGLVTTHGSPLFSDHVPEEDEPMIAALRQAGAIVLGKTNTSEFAAGANTTNSVYGPTGNPFDPVRTCGGSSGGSAVALATSMLPLCTGSDLGGSLRIPAAYCGIVGFRPSPGAVASNSRSLGWTPLSVDGPMARTVQDVMLFFGAQLATKARDPLTVPTARSDPASGQPVDLASLRVAVSEDLGFAQVDQRIRTTFRDRVSRFEGAFASCEHRDPEMKRADEVFEVMRAQLFLAEHKRRYELHFGALGPNVTANVEQGMRQSAADVAWAHAEQTRIYRRFQACFDNFDILVCPTVSVPPFPHEQLFVKQIDGANLTSYFHWLALTYGLTLTAHPCVSIPCGLDPTGTPFGLQICGPAGADGFVLKVALALERHLASDTHTARPLPQLERLTGQ